MDGTGTVPHQVTGVPIRTLQVEVLEGPNAGVRRLAEADTLTIGTAEGNDLVLSDPTVSGYHLELSQSPRGIQVIDHGSTNGTLVGQVRIARAVVPPGTRLTLGRSAIGVGEGETRHVEILASDSLCGLRGATPVMRRLFAQIEQAARSSAAVLLVGESGTGKELLAEALHERSPRVGGPFVTVDCGALAPTLVASDLFGHERGSFTGADRRHIGAFERANGGTIFLDEIGELPGQLQTVLLGVLERRRLRRLGGSSDIEIDVRIISATNRDLRSEVNAGRFRLDLYYRLAVLPLAVPALRERLDDIPLLIEHFLRHVGHTGPIEEVLSRSAIDTLCQYHWPGNVRELRNFVEATVAMGEASAIATHSPLHEAAGSSGGSATTTISREVLGLTYKEARASVLENFETEYFRALLERAGGNVSEAARQAKMDRSHLSGLLKRRGLR